MSSCTRALRAGCAARAGALALAAPSRHSIGCHSLYASSAAREPLQLVCARALSSGPRADGPQDGVLGALNKKLQETIEGDASIKAAFEGKASESSGSPAGARPDARSAGEGSEAGAGSAPPPPPKPSRWYLFSEDVKDVFSVAFGLSRSRDVGKEVDMGLRAYGWSRYVDPSSGTTLYRNADTGLVTEVEPPDWGARSTSASVLSVDGSSTAIALHKPTVSPWERTLASLYNTPIIQGLLVVGEAVKASPVGTAAKAAATRVSDAKEAALESWETSQHPLIVNSSYVVDSMMSETDHGRALRGIRSLDAGFDEYSFVVDMRDEYIPHLATAFFRLDMPFLQANCRPSALAQMAAVQAARAVECLSHDGQVLSVSKVEILQARTLDAGERGGTMPVVVVSAQVQYIHCVRNKKVRRHARASTRHS
jgi:hypothetical protein